MSCDAKDGQILESTSTPADPLEAGQSAALGKVDDHSAESGVEFGYVEPAVIAYCDHIPPSVCSAELRALGYQLREMGDPRWVDVLIQSAKNI